MQYQKLCEENNVTLIYLIDVILLYQVSVFYLINFQYKIIFSALILLLMAQIYYVENSTYNTHPVVQF